MKIKEAIKIINSTKTAVAGLGKEKIYFYANDGVDDFDWFLMMPQKADKWDDVKEDFEALYSITPKDLALVMDVVQRLICTPVNERFPEKKYCLEAVRHYSGPIAEKGYVKNVVCKSDYSGFEYSPVPFEFTEKELETMKKNDPVLAPAIDAMKEEVKDNETD